MSPVLHSTDGPWPDQGAEPTAVGFSMWHVLRQLPVEQLAEIRREARRCRPGGRLERLLEDVDEALECTETITGTHPVPPPPPDEVPPDAPRSS